MKSHDPTKSPRTAGFEEHLAACDDLWEPAGEKRTIRHVDMLLRQDGMVGGRFGKNLGFSVGFLLVLVGFGMF